MSTHSSTTLTASTQALLEAHHGDGDVFAQKMLNSHATRHDDAFWSTWTEWIEPILGDPPTVLDLGCGPGALVRDIAQRYPGARVVGVEVAEYMLAAAVDLPEGAEIMLADLHDPHLPVADGSADAAVSAAVLHEMNQPVRALLELVRCLKPGGRFVLIDWMRGSLESYLARKESGPRVFDGELSAEELAELFVHFTEHNRYTQQDLLFLLEHSGLRVLDVQATANGRHTRIVSEKMGG